jgi:hypothetical protein
MHYTIEELIRGNADTVAYYNAAKVHWKEILQSEDAVNAEKLSQTLNLEQLWFEHNCGGRFVGQEIMAIVGIAQFYTTDAGFAGNEEMVLKVYDALRSSYCSLEVKWHAEKVAESYDLLELRDGFLETGSAPLELGHGK